MGCCEHGEGRDDGQQTRQLEDDEQDTHSCSNNTSQDKSEVPSHLPPPNPIPKAIAPSLSPFECDSEQWIEGLPSTEHISLFKSTNWAATSLGPLSKWNIILRIYTYNVMADSQAAVIYWGPERVSIYNEAFIPLAGKLHPDSLMGVPFDVAFPELAEPVGPVFALARSSGRAADVREMEMFVERNQFIEETYFTGTFVPLRGYTGEVEGFYNAVHEITKAMINDRRSAMLNVMEAPPVTDIQQLANHIIPSLERNPRDIPMAILYKVEEDVPGKLSLQGSIGIPDGHPLNAKQLDLSSSEGLAPLLRKSKTKITTIPVDENFIGVEWQGYGEVSNFVSILPIIGVEDRLCGFLVVGANSRRPVDAVHQQFMRDLSLKVSSIFTAIISAEESRSRAERLEKHLADSMKQIRYLAENASVGMAYISPGGIILWANQEFYAITGHTREEDFQSVLSFLDVYVDEDRPLGLEVWNRLLAGEHNLSMEVRLKRLYQPPSGEAEYARVLCHSSARLEDNEVKSVMTIITDVSAFRWAEASEARRATQAEEAKRLQEEFIDFVSHELRNPLSAIFQLAETILTSFPANGIGQSITNTELTDALRNNIDNASTILLCAQHQKRIVDDVLTLSKLEYTMLSVSPRPTRLPTLVERWMKMFETQLVSYDIQLKIIPHHSIADKNNSWVLCDESRIQQIFLNLMTNAIKFTKAERKRQLTVEYSVVLSEPRTNFPSDIRWAPNQREFEDLTLEPVWGLGQPIFLTFAIRDTGIGMTSEEIRKLFGRFEQANARTTIKYGGSGLGLFLSQRLAERQAGEIGVASELGKGSTFAFYVKSRRVEDGSIPVPVSDSQLPSSRSISYNSGSKSTLLDLSKLHILLVEDNLVNQQVVQKQLIKAGCVVQVANHGIEALEMIRESDIWHQESASSKHLDVILMDWEMPIMDGLACSREIRALQKAGKITRHIEIIATTANARDEQIATALASGCDCVVSKPFMVKDLLVKIRERLNLSAARFSVPRLISEP